MNSATMAHLDGFHYGLVNPVLAYAIASIGAALGLRCTVRALDLPSKDRLGWLLLAASAIGCGIWTMHFIAMLGFTVTGSTIVYDVPVTIASLLLAIVVVGIGVVHVGYRPRGLPTLLVGGTLMGVGVAVMHYLGMAAMQVQGSVSYHPLLVLASVVIAVAASTTALWMTLNVRGLIAALGSALVAGVAVVAMHYTAMAAVTVHLDGRAVTGGLPASQFILPLAVGVAVFLTAGAIIVTMSPTETARASGPEPELIP
ncbi:MHYT domain-containing protein [Streptacidiphilus jiangxiensis]|uniref:MHYT domain-containing protein n=1 Tax=Streptacidiphilus jiangxiensis TaxID=235985 RepID=UPI0009E01F49|nr:MHYT domain-containing protein [Streptacidiphilus jiangxiensis]